MVRRGVRPSRVTYTAAVAGLNRPRHAEWGPKLEKLARLLQDRVDAPGDDGAPAGRSEAECEEGCLGLAGPGEVALPAGSPSQSGEGGAAGGSERESSRAPRCLGSMEAFGGAEVTSDITSLVSVLRKEGFHPSTRAYRSVIYACARVGLLAEAVALAREMERGLRGRPSPRGGKERRGTDHAVRGVGSRGLDVTGEATVRGAEAGEGVRGAGRAPPGTPEAPEPLGDGEAEEPDMSVVYNCIVCNFARAASRDSSSGGKKDDGCRLVRKGNRTHPETLPGKAVALEGDLISLLQDLAGLSEESLSEEAASGGVDVVGDSAPTSVSVGGGLASLQAGDMGARG